MRGVRTLRAFDGSPSYVIVVDGRPTKIGEFRTRVTTGQGGGVTAIMWGICPSLRALVSTGGPGRLARSTWLVALPDPMFRGPNLAKEAVKAEAAKAFFQTALLDSADRREAPGEIGSMIAQSANRARAGPPRRRQTRFEVAELADESSGGMAVGQRARARCAASTRPRSAGAWRGSRSWAR